MMVNNKYLYKILSLPKHLQTSTIALLKTGNSMASDVARITGKARALESAYLNQLAMMRIANKTRRGKKVFFSINYETLDW